MRSGACGVTILVGDSRQLLATLPDESVNCCVTSPPYWGLRDYGHAEQIGQESTPAEYVASLVAVFAEVRRALRADGTLWLNLGDSYAAQRGGSAMPAETLAGGVGDTAHRGRTNSCNGGRQDITSPASRTGPVAHRNAKAFGLKHKDLAGIPWMVAFALRDAGWWLRSEIIWHKLNPMPESVTDRPTSAHEKLFLFAKSESYYYDSDAIREKGVTPAGTLGAKGSVERFTTPGVNSRPPTYKVYDGTRNKRNVWSVASAPYAEAHFATYPPSLITPCILAGCPAGGTVLDPFGGSGTTGMVALELGRNAILIELNPEYAKLIDQRTNTTRGFGF